MDLQHVEVATYQDVATARTSLPTLAAYYESVEAALEAARAESAGAVNAAAFVEFSPGLERPFRAVLMAEGEGEDDDTADEKCYLVTRHHQGVRLTLAGTLEWVLGTTSVPVAVGGRADHKACKSVTLTDAGIASKLTGFALTKHDDAGGAAVVVYDIGNAIGLLRVLAVSASEGMDAVSPVGARWS